MRQRLSSEISILTWNLYKLLWFMGKLVLVRHGQSMWNKKNLFTGWVDVPLSNQGIDEAIDAGKKIASISFDRVFLSTLIRAQTTAMLALAQSNIGKTPVIQHNNGSQKMKDWTTYDSQAKDDELPVETHWQLNERYYGDLQGLDKEATRKKYGEEQVKVWRRSYDIPPPAGEALKNTAERTIPFFNESVRPLLDSGHNILLVAHGNSLRSIIMVLDALSEDSVTSLEIATGVPRVYMWDSEKPVLES
jgi:2,3-bisphosphoglycerate-dependent phosphoglycerate mutase